MRQARGSLVLVLEGLALVGAGGACGGLPRVEYIAPGAADSSEFLVRTFEPANQPYSTDQVLYAISPDWTLLAIWTGDDTIELFDVATGLPAGPSLEGGFDVVRWWGDNLDFGHGQFLTFSTDGRLLFWAHNKKVVVWDVSTREVLLKQEIKGLRNRWEAMGAGVRVVPGGRFLVWTTDDGVVVWDSSSRRATSVPNEHGVCGFTSDGRLLAMTHSLWDLERGREVAAGVGGTCVGISPNGRYVATAGREGMGLWDIAGSRALPPFSARSSRHHAWSPDGRFLAFDSGDQDSEAGEIEVWDLEAEPRLHRVVPRGYRGSYDNLCRATLVITANGGLLSDTCAWTTNLWDLSQPSPRLMLSSDGPLPVETRAALWSGDGKLLVYEWGTGGMFNRKTGFGLWSIEGERSAGPRIAVRRYGWHGWLMQLSPDARLLASAAWGPGTDGKDGFMVQLWDLEAIMSADRGEAPQNAQGATSN
jgi:WD40 repeat protein